MTGVNDVVTGEFRGRGRGGGGIKREMRTLNEHFSRSRTRLLVVLDFLSSVWAMPNPNFPTSNTPFPSSSSLPFPLPILLLPCTVQFGVRYGTWACRSLNHEKVNGATRASDARARSTQQNHQKAQHKRGEGGDGWEKTSNNNINIIFPSIMTMIKTAHAAAAAAAAAADNDRLTLPLQLY